MLRHDGQEVPSPSWKVKVLCTWFRKVSSALLIHRKNCELDLSFLGKLRSGKGIWKDKVRVSSIYPFFTRYQHNTCFILGILVRKVSNMMFSMNMTDLGLWVRPIMSRSWQTYESKHIYWNYISTYGTKETWGWSFMSSTFTHRLS